jgi:hypothetical protein
VDGGIFGSQIGSSSISDGNISIEKMYIINSCLIESFYILDEKKITEDKYSVSLKVTASNGNLHLVNNGSDSKKYIIFKNIIDAKQYSNYLFK